MNNHQQPTYADPKYAHPARPAHSAAGTAAGHAAGGHAAGGHGGAGHGYAPTVTDVADIAEAFNIFDLNRTGFIKLREAEIALRALDLTYNPADAASLCDSGKIGKIGFVSQQSFSSYALNQLATRTKLQRHELLFNLFDIGHKGYITLEDLKQKVVELGEESNITDDDLEAMISEAVESEGRCEVRLSEFSKILSKAENIQKHRLRENHNLPQN